jgi:HPr kinase/phosphorylase
MKELLIHGTCVALNQKAVLICGKPGFGKSSLALQLIDRGATLIADDQTILILEKEKIMATAPLALKGLMEVREVGICSLSYQDKSPLKLCVDLCEENQLERLPKCNFAKHHGLRIPLLKLKKNDPLGAIKVELKLGSMGLKLSKI